VSWISTNCVGTVLFHCGAQLPAHVRSVARILRAPWSKRQHERDLSSCCCCFRRSAATWFTHRRKEGARRSSQEKSRRQKLYKQFIEEASKLYAAALVRDNSDFSTLVNVYALIGQMRILSSDAVIEGAESVVRMIVDSYLSPNQPFPELRELMNSRAADPLREFSEACRNELSAFKQSQRHTHVALTREAVEYATSMVYS
jgi:hypothetical protein